MTRILHICELIPTAGARADKRKSSLLKLTEAENNTIRKMIVQLMRVLGDEAFESDVQLAAGKYRRPKTFYCIALKG